MATPMLLMDDIVLRYLHQPDQTLTAVAGEPDVAVPDSEASMEAVPVEDGLHFGKRSKFLSVQLPDAQMDEPLDTDIAVGDVHRLSGCCIISTTVGMRTRWRV